MAVCYIFLCLYFLLAATRSVRCVKSVKETTACICRIASGNGNHNTTRGLNMTAKSCHVPQLCVRHRSCVCVWVCACGYCKRCPGKKVSRLKGGKKPELNWTEPNWAEMKWNCRPRAPTTDLIRLWSNELKAEPTHKHTRTEKSNTNQRRKINAAMGDYLLHWGKIAGLELWI